MSLQNLSNEREIDPKETKRAAAFELWMTSPMPMVTLTKTFDVTRLRKVSKQKGWRFNMLLCWCIGKAASQVEEFFFPIPSRTDGWRPWRPVFGIAAKSNESHIK